MKDQRFDPPPMSGGFCPCGQHASPRDHDESAGLLQCAQVENEEERYQGVVASAVMRAVFPENATRRALLRGREDAPGLVAW